jgi:hypothetical protein
MLNHEPHSPNCDLEPSVGGFLMKEAEFSALGKRVRYPIRELDTAPRLPKVTWVVITSEKVMALCPITGQPDYDTATIAFDLIALSSAGQNAPGGKPCARIQRSFPQAHGLSPRHRPDPALKRWEGADAFDLDRSLNSFLAMG